MLDLLNLLFMYFFKSRTNITKAKMICYYFIFTVLTLNHIYHIISIFRGE